MKNSAKVLDAVNNALRCFDGELKMNSRQDQINHPLLISNAGEGMLDQQVRTLDSLIDLLQVDEKLAIQADDFAQQVLEEEEQLAHQAKIRQQEVEERRGQLIEQRRAAYEAGKLNLKRVNTGADERAIKSPKNDVADTGFEQSLLTDWGRRIQRDTTRKEEMLSELRGMEGFEELLSDMLGSDKKVTSEPTPTREEKQIGGMKLEGKSKQNHWEDEEEDSKAFTASLKDIKVVDENKKKGD